MSCCKPAVLCCWTIWWKQQRLQNVGWLQVPQTPIWAESRDYHGWGDGGSSGHPGQPSTELSLCPGALLCGGRCSPGMWGEATPNSWIREGREAEGLWSWAILCQHSCPFSSQAHPRGRTVDPPSSRKGRRKESSELCPFWSSSACWHHPHPFSDTMHAATWESISVFGRKEMFDWDGCLAHVVYLNTPVLSWTACWVFSCQVPGQVFWGCHISWERNCRTTTTNWLLTGYSETSLRSWDTGRALCGFSEN